MPDAARRETSPLAAPEITDSYEIIPGRSDAGLILICDHAVNALPGLSLIHISEPTRPY